MSDIELIIDEEYEEPKVVIYARERSEDVLRIVEAVRSASDAELSVIPAYSGGKLELVPQRDIMRVRTEGRQIVLDTENKYYIVRQTLTRLENELDSERFIRISQSEIVNIYKVKHFDISIAGTISMEFVNGVKTYASRRFVKPIKSFIAEREGR